MPVTLIAGLGNPGREYSGTRHNLGFTVVDSLAQAEKLSWKHEPRFEADVARWATPGQPVRWLVKPTTYMNESGRALRRLLDFHKLTPADLAVAYDDLNLDLGRVKVSVQGGPGGHNGIISLLTHVGDGFLRYRLGIGVPRHPELELKEFVLGRFTEQEDSLLQKNLTQLTDGLRLLITSDPAQAMNILNRRDRHENHPA